MLFLAVAHNVITPDGNMITAVILCVFLTYAALQNNKSQIAITNIPSLIAPHIKIKPAIETRNKYYSSSLLHLLLYCREIPSMDACARKARYKTLKKWIYKKTEQLYLCGFLHIK